MAVPDEILGRYTGIQGLEYGTRFYRADLHFHTPASSDARGRNKYGFNPYVVSHLTGKIPADASVLEDLKGLRDLKFLRKHRLLEGMRKLDIDDLERIESKVLKDVELLRKILDLRSLQNKKNKATGDHEAIQELDAGIRASIQDIQSLEGIQNISLAFLECEEIKSLQLLKAGDPIPQVREKVASELESKLFEIRVIKDLKILNDPGLHKIFRDQPGRNFHGDLELDVPAAGYPSSVREFQYQIYLYAKIKAAQIVCGFLEKGLSLVAVTDHNGIGTIWVDDEKRMDLAAPTWYELLDDATRKANERWNTKLQILPGVEISATGIHILAIFPRQEPRRKVHFMICDLLNSIGITPEKWGKNPAVGWASPYDTIEQITKKGGLAIPAHIDGSDQALLDLHDLTSGAMKNVLGNENLSAVEILDPGKFTDKGSSLKAQLEEVRRQKGLPSLAYFQGSDSHDMVDIAKRFTYLKMTEPSFDGLKTAIKIPSSRVRIEASYKEFNGLYIRGMAFDHPDLGVRVLRFNRNLNCITGKIGAGKRILHDLIQAAVNPACPYPGKSKKPSITNSHVTLFVESISDHQGENKTARPGLVSRTYAFHREAMQSQVEIYFVDPDRKTAVRLEEAGETTAPPQPEFYDAREMEQIIADENREPVPHQENPFQAFLAKYIGMPDAVNLDEINDLFFTPRFLDSPNRMQLEGRKTALESVVEPLEREKKLLEKNRGKLEKSKADTLKKSNAELRNINVQLGNHLLKLSLDASKNYRLEMNVQWRVPDQPASMKDFFALTPSQRKAALMCMIIMRSRLPVMIDAPEAEFDAEDMAKYLVPVILEYKDTRQILLFTNHPLLAVNTDPDNYLIVPSNPRQEPLVAGFAIDTQVKKLAETGEDEEAEGKKERPDADEEQQTQSRAQDNTSAEVDKKLLLLSILEGDLGAFRKRASRYE